MSRKYVSNPLKNGKVMNLVRNRHYCLSIFKVFNLCGFHNKPVTSSCLFVFVAICKQVSFKYQQCHCKNLCYAQIFIVISVKWSVRGKNTMKGLNKFLCHSWKGELYFIQIMMMMMMSKELALNLPVLTVQKRTHLHAYLVFRPDKKGLA